MKLKGKALEEFEAFAPGYLISNIKDVLGIVTIPEFYSTPFSMQWGVYQDFFDSVGMEIYTKPFRGGKHSVYIDKDGHHILSEYITCNTRQEAREKAIEKAVEIFNERV